MGYHPFWLAHVLDAWRFLMKIRYPVTDFCTSCGSEGNPARDFSACWVQKSWGKPPVFAVTSDVKNSLDYNVIQGMQSNCMGTRQRHSSVHSSHCSVHRQRSLSHLSSLNDTT